MATFDYAQAARDALALIQEFGQEVQMTRVSGGTFNPGTGATTGAITETQTVTLVTVPASGLVTKFDDALKEQFVKGRLRFFIAAALGLTFAPAPGYKLTYEGKQWELFGSTPLSPAGTPIIYEFAAREGGAA